MELRIPPVRKQIVHEGNLTFALETPPLRLIRRALTYLIGHNGSGKSLFANIVAGELNNGLDFVAHTETGDPARVILVRQRPEQNICLELSVEENLAIRSVAKPSFSQLLRTQMPQRPEREDDLLSRLRPRWNVEAGRLSSGEQQVLVFECARQSAADAFFLDEFTSALDPAAKLQILPQVRALGDAAVVIISHDVDEVCENADYLIALARGRVEFEGPRPDTGWDRARIRALASGLHVQ